MLRKLRFLTALVLTFLARFKVLLISGLFFGVVVFLVGVVLLPHFLPRKVSYIGLVGRYRVEELPDSILSQIGNGLTKINKSGEVEPDLAVEWRAQDSGKTWIFTLNTNRKWQDGTNITSETLQYSFDNVGVETPDTKTIIFKLQNPYAPFPFVVSRQTFKKGLLGTGEWKVTNISLQSGYVEMVELASSEREYRRYRFYPSEDAAKTAYKLGQVDHLSSIIDPYPFESWNTTLISQNEQKQRYIGVFFNLRSDNLKNKSLRQALSYAIDKSTWQGERRAIGPIPQESWAYNSQVKPYDYDPKRAKELLREAVPAGDTLTLNLTTNPELLTVASQIAANWKDIGVSTAVQASSSLPSDFDAYLAFYEVSLDPDQYLTWHSTQEETNVTHYANARIDKLLEDGRLELDHEKRKKIYLDFQRFLLEDAPAAFLYHPVTFDISRK